MLLPPVHPACPSLGLCPSASDSTPDPSPWTAPCPSPFPSRMYWRPCTHPGQPASAAGRLLLLPLEGEAAPPGTQTGQVRFPFPVSDSKMSVFLPPPHDRPQGQCPSLRARLTPTSTWHLSLQWTETRTEGPTQRPSPRFLHFHSVYPSSGLHHACVTPSTPSDFTCDTISPGLSPSTSLLHSPALPLLPGPALLPAWPGLSLPFLDVIPVSEHRQLPGISHQSSVPSPLSLRGPFQSMFKLSQGSLSFQETILYI